MTSEWQYEKLGDITTNLDAKRKPVKEADRKHGPYPYYGASGIVDYVEDYLFDGEHLLIAEDGENLRTRQTPIAFRATGKFWVNNHAHIVIGNQRASTRYLEYAVQGTDISAYLTGAVMPKLTQGNLNRIEVPCPPRAVQDSIVAVLGNLDDRITLLRDTNSTLEAIAQAAFKSWFVDFDPVRAKQEGRQPEGMDEATAALSPDTFETTELGEIPKGWKNELLENLVIPKRGKTITKAKCIEGDVPVVAGGLEPAYFHNQSNVASPVITVSASGANAGFVRLYQQDVWASDCSYLSKEQTPLVFYWYLFLKLNQEKIYFMQQGAAQPHIYPSDLMRLNVCYPENAEITKIFNDLVTPLFERIRVANEEIHNLANLRDTLLPRLISGQLRLPDAEEQIEAAKA